MVLMVIPSSIDLQTYGSYFAGMYSYMLNYKCVPVVIIR